MTRQSRNIIIAGSSLIFFIACLVYNQLTDFVQTHNDFWDTFYAARILSFANPDTWFNPQYPIGYCFLLKLIMGSGLPVVPAILLNVFFGTLIVAGAAWIYTAILPWPFALLSLGLLLVFPEFVYYINNGGGDPGSIMFFTFGSLPLIFSLFKTRKAPSNELCIASGIMFGLSALFRYHALVAGGLFIIALCLVYRQNWKSWALIGVGMGLAYCPQPILNLITGHGILETRFGALNVYDLVHKINWYKTTSTPIPESALDVILGSPALFLKKYMLSFLSFKQAYLPAIFLVLFERDKTKKRLYLLILTWMLAYFLMFSATTSGRQILLVLPLSFLTWGLFFQWLYKRLQTFSFPMMPKIARGVIVPVLLFMLTALQLNRNALFFSIKSDAKNTFQKLESFLNKDGLKEVREIFTSDFNFYLQNYYPYIPYHNGGVPRLSTYGYSEEFPELPVENLEAFIRACKSRGIKYVVLHSKSEFLSPALGDLYSGETRSTGIGNVFETSDHKVFKLNPNSESIEPQNNSR